MTVMSKKTIWVIIAGAVLLRLPGLFDSFWLDEAAQAIEVTRPWFEQLAIAKDFQPPLLHLYLHFFQYLGTTEWWLRWWGALLPGLLTIYCTYVIGKRLFSHQTGLIAAAFLSTSSLHVFFSQELRPYSLPAFWASLSWLLLTQKKPTTNSWILFSLVTAAGLYSSYLYPFLALSQLVSIVYDRKLLKPVIASMFGSAVLFLPWLPSLLEQLAIGTTLRSSLPGWENVVSTSAMTAPFLVAGKFVLGLDALDLNLATVLPFLTVVTTVLLLLKNFWGVASSQQKSYMRLLFTWLVVPFVSAWLVTWFIPVISPKRLLFLLPAWYLIVAALTTLPIIKPLQSRISTFLIILIFALNGVGLIKYYFQPNLQRENWRTLHTTIINTYPASDSLAVFGFDEPFAPWIWYDDGNYPTLATGVLVSSTLEAVTTQLKVAHNYQYVLVFDYLRDLSDPQGLIEASLTSLGFTEVDYLDTPQIGFVRVYARSTATISQNLEKSL